MRSDAVNARPVTEVLRELAGTALGGLMFGGQTFRDAILRVGYEMCLFALVLPALWAINGGDGEFDWRVMTVLGLLAVPSYLSYVGRMYVEWPLARARVGTWSEALRWRVPLLVWSRHLAAAVRLAVPVSVVGVGGAAIVVLTLDGAEIQWRQLALFAVLAEAIAIAVRLFFGMPLAQSTSSMHFRSVNGRVSRTP